MNIKKFFSFNKNKQPKIIEKIVYSDIGLENNIDLFSFYTELSKIDKNFKISFKSQKKNSDILNKNIEKLSNLYSNFKEELSDLKKNENEKLIKKICIPLIESLDRIYNLKEISKTIKPNNFFPKLFFKTKNFNSLMEGFQIAEKYILDKLKIYNVEKINTINKFFNPEFMEAVKIINNKKIKDNLVVEEIERGYKSSNFIIRNAKVTVNILKKNEVKENE